MRRIARTSSRTQGKTTRALSLIRTSDEEKLIASHGTPGQRNQRADRWLRREDQPRSPFFSMIGPSWIDIGEAV